MGQLKIKICGMRDPGNIREVLALAPDYMGFIFYKDSKRYVNDKLDNSLLRSFPEQTHKVGVFVNHERDYILEQVRDFRLDMVQLHGDEPPVLCRDLRNEGVPVIKTFSMHPEFSFQIVETYKPHCDYFLFDTKGAGYGGTGRTFNWDLLKQYDQEVPFFLSGGIGPEHTQDLQTYSGLNIHAIDLNSRFENAPGVKDHHLLNDFMDKVRVPAEE